jgi:hypothetical protein
VLPLTILLETGSTIHGDIYRLRRAGFKSNTPTMFLHHIFPFQFLSRQTLCSSLRGWPLNQPTPIRGLGVPKDNARLNEPQSWTKGLKPIPTIVYDYLGYSLTAIPSKKSRPFQKLTASLGFSQPVCLFPHSSKYEPTIPLGLAAVLVKRIDVPPTGTSLCPVLQIFLTVTSAMLSLLCTADTPRQIIAYSCIETYAHNKLTSADLEAALRGVNRLQTA